MNREVKFSSTAWQQYCEWMLVDRSIAKKITELIKDIDRNGPSNGIGKPERLKHIDAWSRRITQEHRLVYDIDMNQNIVIIACKYHYED